MRVILSLLVLCLTSTLNAQNIDTIYVGSNKTSYVVCPETLSYFELGSKEYTGQIKDDTFYLKALSHTAKPTSLLITTASNKKLLRLVVLSDSKYQGTTILKFSDQVKEEGERKVVSLPNPSKTEPVSKGLMEQEKVVEDIAEITDRLKKFVIIASPFKTLTKASNRIIVSVGNIKIVKEHLFVKLQISNFGSQRFVIDSKTAYYNNQNGDLLGSKTELETPLEIISESEASTFVDSRQSKIFGLAFPVESLKGKGKFILSIKEANSERNILLEVPSSIFL